MGEICVRCKQCRKKYNENGEYNIGKDINLSKELAYNSPFFLNIDQNQWKLIKIQRYIKRYLRRKNAKVKLVEKFE